MPITTTTATIVIFVESATAAGYFDACLSDLHLCQSRQPFLDSARRLLELGYPADAVIVMKSADLNTVRLRATIGVAARLTVSEEANRPPRFRRWMPLEMGGGSPRIAAAAVADNPRWPVVEVAGRGHV